MKILIPILGAALFCLQCSLTPLNPDTAEESDFKKAENLYTLNQFDSAAVLLEDFINRYPQSFKVDNAQLMLGKSYRAIGEYQKAVAILRTIKSESPHYEEGLLETGYCMQDDHRYYSIDSAILVFKFLLSQTDQGTWAAEGYYEIGQGFYKRATSDTALQKSDYDSALNYFVEIRNRFKATSRYPDALYRMAWSYYQKDDFVKAAQSFSQFILENPVSPDVDAAQYWFAQSLKYSGDCSGARAAYQKLIDQYPQSENVQDAYREKNQLPPCP